MIDSWIDQMTGEQWNVCVLGELYSTELNQSNLNDGDKNPLSMCVFENCMVTFIILSQSDKTNRHDAAEGENNEEGKKCGKAKRYLDSWWVCGCVWRRHTLGDKI